MEIVANSRQEVPDLRRNQISTIFSNILWSWLQDAERMAGTPWLKTQHTWSCPAGAPWLIFLPPFEQLEQLHLHTRCVFCTSFDYFDTYKALGFSTLRMPQAGIESSQGIGDAGVVDIFKNETLGWFWIAERQVTLPFLQYFSSRSDLDVSMLDVEDQMFMFQVHLSNHLTQDMQCPASATHLQRRDRASSLKPGRKTILLLQISYRL